MDGKRNAKQAKSQAPDQGLSEARPDFIDSFLDFTQHLSSPHIFRKWAAIAAIAGALERKVWVRTMGSNLYPNMYVILVGPPGVGKTEVTWRVRAMWKSLETHYVGSSSITKASMMDELAEATRRRIVSTGGQNGLNPVETFNSLLLCVNELGVLIPAYDNEFMNALTDLWDCKDYSEKRRHSKNKDPIDIKKTQLNMLAACTPSYLQGTLPEGAWDQGFISRTMLIYSGDTQVRSLFAEVNISQEELSMIEEVLESISDLYGEITFTQEAAELIDHFHLTRGEPAPEHPKLMSYKIRRTVHLLKLCMVMSMSRSNELIIRKEDFQRAMDTLIEAETAMPEIFKAMTQGGTGKVMEETWYYVFTTYTKEQKPILKHRLIQYLQERVPVHNIDTVIDMMEQGKMIERILLPAGTAYKPLAKPKAY